MSDKSMRKKTKRDREIERITKEQKRKRSQFKDEINNSSDFKFKPNIPKRNAHIKFNRINPASVPELLLEESDKLEDEELIQREQAAKKIADARKKSVGIAYNKGAYQPIFDPKELGRK